MLARRGPGLGMPPSTEPYAPVVPLYVRRRSPHFVEVGVSPQDFRVLGSGRVVLASHENLRAGTTVCLETQDTANGGLRQALTEVESSELIQRDRFATGGPADRRAFRIGL